MTCCCLDHLVITAPDLDAGSEYVADLLGAVPRGGGVHPAMNTHNRLLRLGDTTYLEVIAPAGAPPARPRWFGLDHLAPDDPPGLATWVARTTDIRAAVARCTVDPGPVVPMSRGALEWLITIPDDGHLPFGGIAPPLIQWQTADHPARALEHSGCSLRGLTLHHPQAVRIEALIDALGLADEVTVSAPSKLHPPGLTARLQTPRGPRELRGIVPRGDQAGHSHLPDG